MLPSNRKNSLPGAVATVHGYGAIRGTPVGRQLASGSAPALRLFMIFSYSGLSTIWSPGFRIREISPTSPLSGRQTPEKSGFPSGRRGVGPVGTTGPRPRPARPPRPGASATLPPGGGNGAADGVFAPPAGACANSGLMPIAAPDMMTPIKNFRT